MTARSQQTSDASVSRRRSPRYRFSSETALDPSESYQAFIEHTDGLTNRLHLRNIDGMRAGTANTPHGLARRYLVAGRSAGLPKDWAMKFGVWVNRQIDALWPMEQTSLRVLEEKAMRAEACDDLAEKRNDLERNAISLRERIQSLTAEIVADQLCLARLERELEDCQ